MIDLVRRACVFAALFLFVGTAPGQIFRIPVSEEGLKAVRSTRVIIALKQEEIIADYVRPRPSGAYNPNQIIMPRVSRGFLTDIIIGTALDELADTIVNDAVSAGRAKRAEEQSEPIRKALQGYAFRSGYEQALSEKLRPIDWLKLTGVTNVSANMQIDEMRREATETMFLLVTTRYSLSPGLRYFRMWCAAVLLANDDTLKNIAAKARPEEKFFRLYRNEFVYLESVGEQPAKPEEAAARWSENNGERIRAAMSEGIGEITRLVAFDLQDLAQGGRPDAARRPLRTVRYLGQDAMVLSETEKRTTLMLPGGALRSVPKKTLAAE